MSVAPGRANLIGDHTDYNGLPVLPIAIRQAVWAAFAPRDDRELRVRSQSQDTEARVDAARRVPARDQGDWRNYVRAAVQGVASVEFPLQGLDAMVGGDLPVAAGLSSSSALVVAVGNALLHRNGRTVSPDRLMELYASAERYVGTEGGGMDQAICLGGVSGHALRIDFDPLRAAPIPVPDDWRILVLFTGVVAEKSARVLGEYNKRVESCRTALELVRSHLGRPQRSYAELLREFGAESLLSAGERVLTETPGLRFRHTVSEAERVCAAIAAMRAGDGPTFGRLMLESHRSLRHDYDVSCAALDRGVEVALESGALGARMTGAGFGGSVVILTDDLRVERVASEIERRLHTEDGLQGARLLRVEPSEGATVREVGSG